MNISEVKKGDEFTIKADCYMFKAGTKVRVDSENFLGKSGKTIQVSGPGMSGAALYVECDNLTAL